MSEISNQKSKIAEKEEEILKFWKENDIFQKTVEKESPKGSFVFFEGPPTANGKPGIHHLEARAFKDVIPRFKTMCGYKVPRRAGWDTHGLPVEIQAEKTLGLKSKKEIEEYGVAEFNKKCKESVFEYLKDWDSFTERIGFWLDQKNAYYTFNNSYIESLWYIVSEINKKKLLYKDYKVVPWCPRCGTGLSSHELAQGYQDVKDLTIYAKFKVIGQENTFLLAWTTTPWTLLGNVALAVGEKIDYVKVFNGKEYFILAKNIYDRIKTDPSSRLYQAFGIIAESGAQTFFEEKEIKGKDLVGIEYEPVFKEMQTWLLAAELQKEQVKNVNNGWKVYSGDFVTTEDGTGIVHIAPMYGTDDFELATKFNLPKWHIVNDSGHFISPIAEFLKERFVKDEAVAVDILKDLDSRELRFHKEPYSHSYPHCWRCKTPLIYFARDSWYIKMSALRDDLVKENEGINWEPNYIKEGRFGEWLREIRDWAISRERYWGTPLPVWTDQEGKEIFIPDSIESLKKKTKKSGNKYFLMRHGEAEQNVLGIESSDEEAVHHLTEKGIADSKNTAEKLKKEKIDLIIHSPITRTKETALEVKKILGDVEIISDKRITEEVLGGLSGIKVGEFEKYFSCFNDRMYKSVKNCETLLEAKKRVGEFIYDVEKRYQNKNILIISHGGPMSLMKCVANGVIEKDLEEQYGVDMMPLGEYKEFEFVPIPHNENYELDLHKPYIDEIEVLGEKNQTLKRTKEVMDVWFDSGAMPFASNHYPMENKKFVEGSLFPADYICEAIDQTRGWFYTLHAVGVLLGKGKAFKNVICLGHLMDKTGKKMSKSLGNIVEPWEQMNKYGADAIRLWMYSVNQPGESKNYDEKTVDEIVKKNFNLLSNVLTFYELYREKELESNDHPEKFLQRENVLDKWILARLSELVGEGTNYLNEYKILEPVRTLREFIDDLSTWYVRRSRERLRDGDKDAKKTLYFVLKTISKYMAPFAPFYAESLYQNLRLEKDVESVHLENWPTASKVDENIIEEMKAVRLVCSLGLKARSDAKINVRQPLASLKLKVESLKLKEEYKGIIRDEINVKEVIFDNSIQDEVFLDTEITSELKEEGTIREFIRAIQDFRKEKGFEAKDRAVLSVSCDEAFKKLVLRFESEIKKVAGLDNIEFIPEAEKEITLLGFSVKVSIKKL